MRTTIQLLLAIFAASFLVPAVRAQQKVGYPAYTGVSISTEYDNQGTVVFTDKHIRYQSASGDWRSVWNDNDSEVATLYRRGRGVYQSNSRTARTIKVSDHAPGCDPTRPLFLAITD